MAPRLPVASRTRARTKKEDPFAGRFCKAEPGRRKGSSGVEIGGGGARRRASSVSSRLGAGGGASDDHEVIIITDNEDSSDEPISVSGSGEEEEEPCDYGLQAVRGFEHNRVSRKGKNIIVDDDDGGGDSDKEESTESDNDLIYCGEVRSFGEQSKGNRESFRSEDDYYVQNVSGKNTPSVTRDAAADHSPDYLNSTSESSIEADDSSDEDFVTSELESSSAIGETSSSSEEYVSRSEGQENLERKEKGKSEDKGKPSNLYSARKNDKKIVIDKAKRKEDAKHGVSWDNEWSQDDVEKGKEEETLNVDRFDVEIRCPVDDNGNSRQTEERGNFSVPEHGGSRETEETGRGGEDDDERLQEEGKAAIEFDGVNAETDVSSVNGKGEMGEMKERGNSRAPEEGGLYQSREKSTSQSKVSGVDRRMEEKRYGKHAQSDSDSVIRDAASSKVDQKESDSGMSHSSQQLQKKRKHEDCSSEKAFAANEITENDGRVNWKSRTTRERASVWDHERSRETEETGRGGKDDDEWLQEEGKAAIEFDGLNADTDVSFGNEKGKMGELEGRGNFRALEEGRLNQSPEKSTSQSKVSGVDRRMEEKRYGKHVQSDSDSVIRDAASSKVGRKERDLGLSYSSQQLQKKRKHVDCSGEKAFAANGIAENDGRANWKSRTRRERAGVSKRGRLRETEETGCGGEDDDEWLQEEGKAATEFGGLNAETDVSFGNEKGKMGEMAERGDFRAPEEEQLNQSRGKSTSQSKVSGVDRRTGEKGYGMYVQSDWDPIIRNAASSKVGQKEKDLGISCSSLQLQKRRKHEDRSGKKVFAARVIAENDGRADWESRTRRERTSRSWEHTLFKLAYCLGGTHELLQDDTEKKNEEKGKQCAADSTGKEERKESAGCGISTKPSEEGVAAHQAEVRKERRST